MAGVIRVTLDWVIDQSFTPVPQYVAPSRATLSGSPVRILLRTLPLLTILRVCPDKIFLPGSPGISTKSGWARTAVLGDPSTDTSKNTPQF